MKKVPNIFKPSIDKKIDNNEKAFYSFVKDKKESCDPKSFVDKLLSDSSYFFNKKIVIKTNDALIHTKVAGKIGDYIVTMDGESINISSIIEIYEE